MDRRPIAARLSGFVDASSERLRRIAARLVDLKATALAGRIDEIPSRLMALRSEERPDAAIRELASWCCSLRPGDQSLNDPELKRLVSTSETREQILANPNARQVESHWEVLGEKIETRRERSRQPFDLAARPEQRVPTICPAARLFSGIGRASIKRFRAGRPFQRPDGVLSIARTTARPGGRTHRRRFVRGLARFRRH